MWSIFQSRTNMSHTFFFNHLPQSQIMMSCNIPNCTINGRGHHYSHTIKFKYLMENTIATNKDLLRKCVPECTNKDKEHILRYFHGKDKLDTDITYINMPQRLEEIVDHFMSKFQKNPLNSIVTVNSYNLPLKLNINSKDIRSLKEISLATLANEINANPSDYIGYLSEIENTQILEYLKYPTMLDIVEQGVAVPFECSVEEYFDNQDKEYRNMFVQDRNNPKLDSKLLLESIYNVGVNDVLQEYTYLSRAIPDGNHAILYKSDNKVGQPVFCDYDQFKKQWHYLTGGIFEQIDMSNMFVAGGIVLAALQPFDKNQDLKKQLDANGIILIYF